VAIQEAGYRTIVIEKSRGVGGRAATRRLENTWVDHGAPTLSRDPQDEAQYGAYVTSLVRQGLLQPWPSDRIYRSIVDGEKWRLEQSDSGYSDSDYADYAVPAGMTAIAKALTDSLNICCAQRVITLYLDSEQSYWQLSTEPVDSGQPMTLRARAVVLSIPAPQALELCQLLPESGFLPSTLAALKGVTFDPYITVMAGYTAAELLPWSELRCKGDSVLQRILCDSDKRPTPPETWFVLHSTPAFAARQLALETLAEEAGRQMLRHLGNVYLPWMTHPSWMQVHRWRYAIASGGYPGDPLSANFELPFWICGDWCTGASIQDAFEVGLDIAQRLQIELELER
jgi:renalase